MNLSDVISPISAVTTIIIFVLSVTYYLMKNRDILPGPRGWPYFGLYPVLKNETVHLQLVEYGKKYGDLYSFTYLGNLIINLGSLKAIREVHVTKSDCFAGRFRDFNLLTYVMQDGMAMVNGEPWHVLRKFFVKGFRDYGLTVMRDNTAGPVYASLTRTIEDLYQKKGVPFNVIDLLTLRCMGTMRNVLFGEDGITDERIIEMNRAYGGTVNTMAGIHLLLIGPFAKFLFFVIPRLRQSLSDHKRMRDMLMETVKDIESKMDESHSTCVVEDFYKERNERRRRNDPTWKYFTDKALVETLSQLVGDGILTVAYFIGCFLYAMVEHPEEQEKIYKEVIEVVGPNRIPNSEDRGKLRYTNAFMNEVIRTTDFFTLFPSLQCTKETTIRGYRIPKGAITLLNFWQAHHDPPTYENADKFDPSRFLPTDGKPRPELPNLFGIGKRACAGESFVMLQSVLFVSTIVQNFHISEPESRTARPDLLTVTGEMEFIFTPRKH